MRQETVQEYFIQTSVFPRDLQLHAFEQVTWWMFPGVLTTLEHVDVVLS